MEIISSAKNLIVSDFSNLETKFVYQHSENVESICDFQFFGLRRHLVTMNRNSGIEILRTSDEGDGGICRIKKVRVENIYCAAAPNQNNDEVALGLTNGEVRFFNIKKFEFITGFQSDPAKTGSVVYLDYNARDDYLSSVYESGHVIFYGIKTRKKVETLLVDETCTLAKFHPVKRFHLGITSYNGGVYIYDSHAKTEVVSFPKAHTAPCRDIAMSAGCPDTFLSVGFDRTVNVFDVRKRTKSNRIECDCPLSTVAMSECGQYFCTGNLKGEIQTYDMRNTGKFLTMKKVHDPAMVRLTFVPSEKINQAIRQNINSSLSLIKQRPSDILPHSQIKDETVKNPSKHPKRDSFYDLIDACSTSVQNKDLIKRSSLGMYVELDEKNSEYTFASRLSGVKNPKTTEKITEEIIEEADEESIVFVSDREHENLKDLPQDPKVINKTPIIVSCDSSFNKLISESDTENQDSTDTEFKMKILENDEEKQKDNHSFCKDVEDFPKFSGDKISTPNNLRKIPTNQNQTILCDIKSEIQNIRDEMNKKFTELQNGIHEKIFELENEIKFNAETNKWQLINQNARIFSKQTVVNEQIQETLFYMLKTDEFLNDYLRLKKENDYLKNQLTARRKSN